MICDRASCRAALALVAMTTASFFYVLSAGSAIGSFKANGSSIDFIQVQSKVECPSRASPDKSQRLFDDTNGTCKHYDNWEPILRKQFYYFRPGSMTEPALNFTFAEFRVTHWVTVSKGRFWFWNHPQGSGYGMRGPSILAQIQRMLRRGWPVPDFHLLFEVTDAPRFSLHQAEKVPVPVGAIVTSEGHNYDVAIPDVGFYWWNDWAPSPYKSMQYNDSIHEALAWGQRIPYERRKHAGVFRGSCNSHARGKAAKIAEQHPNVLDIACNRDPIHLLNFSQYKVIINLPGNAGGTWRTKWLLALGSPMVFLNGGERGRPTSELFYHLLQPFVHYWPITSEGQLLPAVQYLLDHPKEAKAIADAAVRFVQDWLNVDEIDCLWLYYAHFLADLGGRQPTNVPKGARDFSNLTFKQMVRTYFHDPWQWP